jgi:hypothetical protein
MQEFVWRGSGKALNPQARITYILAETETENIMKGSQGR